MRTARSDEERWPTREVRVYLLRAFLSPPAPDVTAKAVADVTASTALTIEWSMGLTNVRGYPFTTIIYV